MGTNLELKHHWFTLLTGLPPELSPPRSLLQPPSVGFFLALYFLALQAFAHGPFAGLGGLAGLGAQQAFAQQLVKLRQGDFLVAELAAVILGGDEQVAVGGEAAGYFFEDEGFLRVRQQGRGGQVPAQLHAAFDFVHVLAARPAAAAGGKGDFG